MTIPSRPSTRSSPHASSNRSTSSEPDKPSAQKSSTSSADAGGRSTGFSEKDESEPERRRAPSSVGRTQATSHDVGLAPSKEQIRQMPSFRLGAATTGIIHREDFPERQARRARLGLPEAEKPSEPPLSRRMSLHEFRAQAHITQQSQRSIPFAFGRSRLASDVTDTQSGHQREVLGESTSVVMGGRPIGLTEAQRKAFEPFLKATQWTKETMAAAKNIAVKHGKRGMRGGWQKLRGDGHESQGQAALRDIMTLYSHPGVQMCLYKDNNGQRALRVRQPAFEQETRGLVENRGRGLMYSTTGPLHGINNERSAEELMQANQEREARLMRRQKQEEK